MREALFGTLLFVVTLWCVPSDAYVPVARGTACLMLTAAGHPPADCRR